MEAVEQYQLFKSDTCGFCHRVRSFLQQNNIEVPLRDINQDQQAFRELLAGGGRGMVPCLRIESVDGAVSWMYESMDIMAYLTSKHEA
jgi:glutathione S-transferase|tara:strand:- start:151 stop:414 length:264 start_codon:yes stop_codon:yes gene_type:complete